MRKTLLLVGACIFLASPISAQTPTLVTGTITDPNGLPYSNAQVQAQLIPTGGTPTVIANGIPTAIGGQQNAVADANGSFTMNLFCNTAGGGCSVITAGGAQNTRWQFTVQETGVLPPIGTGPQTFSVTINITGASQSVSSTLSAAALALTRISGSTPSPPFNSLQYDNAGVLGGSHFDYLAGGSNCSNLLIVCDAIVNDQVDSGSGISITAPSDFEAAGFNQIEMSTAKASDGGGGFFSYSKSSIATQHSFGPQTLAGFFHATIIGNGGAPSLGEGLAGTANTSTTDTANGQNLLGVVGRVAMNKTAGGAFIEEGTSLTAVGGACDIPACVTTEIAHKLYGLKVLDMGGFGSVEQAGIKINAQTPGAGTTYSIKCDAGCGIANFGDGAQVRATAFASLPACAAGTEGLVRAVTDSNTNVWGANIAAGGANHVLGYCDGTNWTVSAK